MTCNLLWVFPRVRLVLEIRLPAPLAKGSGLARVPRGLMICHSLRVHPSLILRSRARYGGLPCSELLPLNRVLRNEDVVAAGLQTSHHRFPQLIEDGLSPEAHLQRALKLDHPIATAIPSTPAVQNALEWGLRCPNLPFARNVVCEILQELAEAKTEEDEEILNLCIPT